MGKQIRTFEKTLQKSYLIIEDIESELSWEGSRGEAYAALRVVLHTLRDRLSVGDAVRFGAQLPMLLRGLYYEGWDPHTVPHKMKKEEFLEEIERQLTPPFEFRPDGVVRAVINSLRKHLDPHEIEKIESILPKEYGEILE